MVGHGWDSRVQEVIGRWGVQGPPATKRIEASLVSMRPCLNTKTKCFFVNNLPKSNWQDWRRYTRKTKSSTWPRGKSRFTGQNGYFFPVFEREGSLTIKHRLAWKSKQSCLSILSCGILGRNYQDPLIRLRHSPLSCCDRMHSQAWVVWRSDAAGK